MYTTGKRTGPWVGLGPLTLVGTNMNGAVVLRREPYLRAFVVLCILSGNHDNTRIHFEFRLRWARTYFIFISLGRWKRRV